MATSLGPYAGPAAEEAIESLSALNQRYKNSALLLVFLAIVGIFVAAWFKYLQLTPVVWAMIIATDLYVLFTVIPYLMGWTIPTWVSMFFVGLAGKDNKLPEGIKNATKWSRKLWRAGLWMVVYSSIGLWVVAIFDIEENFHLIFPMIASALGATVLSILLFDGDENSKPLLAWILYAIKLSCFVVLLLMAWPGKTGLTVTRWVEDAKIWALAHKAEDRAERANAGAISRDRASCYKKIEEDSLKGPVAKARFEECAAKGAEKQSPDVTATPVATPAPAPSQGTTGTVVTSTQTTATKTCTPYQEFDYDPSVEPARIEGLPTGEYQVTLSGRQMQPLHRKQDNEPFATCWIKPEGVAEDCRNPMAHSLHWDKINPELLASAPGQELKLPVPTEKFGKVILYLEDGTIQPIGSQGRFKISAPGNSVIVGRNVHDYSRSWGGAGKYRSVISRCV